MRLGHFPWHWWPAIKVEREIKGKYYLDHREYIYARERSLHVQQIDHAHSENISCCNCRYQCFCDIGSYSICYFTSYFPLASLGLHRFQCFNITLVHNSLCVWRLPSPHFGNHVWKSSDLTVSIQSHSRVILCNNTLVQEAAQGCLFLTAFLLLLCLWEHLGGNSVTMKFWVAVTHTTGSILGGGTCMNWACVGGITHTWSLRKHDTHQAEDKKRKKSILGAAWLLNILLLQ